MCCLFLVWSTDKFSIWKKWNEMKRIWAREKKAAENVNNNSFMCWRMWTGHCRTRYCSRIHFWIYYLGNSRWAKLIVWFLRRPAVLLFGWPEHAAFAMNVFGIFLRRNRPASININTYLWGNVPFRNWFVWRHSECFFLSPFRSIRRRKCNK